MGVRWASPPEGVERRPEMVCEYLTIRRYLSLTDAERRKLRVERMIFGGKSDPRGGLVFHRELLGEWDRYGERFADRLFEQVDKAILKELKPEKVWVTSARSEPVLTEKTIRDVQRAMGRMRELDEARRRSIEEALGPYAPLVLGPFLYDAETLLGYEANDVCPCCGRRLKGGQLCLICGCGILPRARKEEKEEMKKENGCAGCAGRYDSPAECGCDRCLGGGWDEA